MAAVDGAQYLLLMAACVVLTLPLEFVFEARVYRRPARLVRAMASPFVLFWVIDAVAISRQLWGYAPRYTSGWFVPRDVPVEELVFFAVVPLCALLTFEAARSVYEGRVPTLRARLRFRTRARAGSPEAGGGRVWAPVLGAAGLAVVAVVAAFATYRPGGWIPPARGWRPLPPGVHLQVLHSDPNHLREYTALAFALVALVGLVEWRWRTGLLRTRAYRSTMLICLGFMIPVNGWLTKLSAPIVVYAPDEFSGWRPIWDIPAEDYLFGVALLTLVLLCWVRAGRQEVAPAAPLRP